MLLLYCCAYVTLAFVSSPSPYFESFRFSQNHDRLHFTHLIGQSTQYHSTFMANNVLTVVGPLESNRYHFVCDELLFIVILVKP